MQILAIVAVSVLLVLFIILFRRKAEACAWGRSLSWFWPTMLLGVVILGLVAGAAALFGAGFWPSYSAVLLALCLELVFVILTA